MGDAISEGSKRLKLNNGLAVAVPNLPTVHVNAERKYAAIVGSRNDCDVCSLHPVVKDRALMVYSLLGAYKLLKDFNMYVAATPATREEIRKFHDEEYVAALERGDADGVALKPEEFGLAYDCIVFPGLWDMACRIAGSTITAAKLLCRRDMRVVVNWLGGWHHGQRFEAAGFCYVNDIVLGILELRSTYSRILYIDLDVHHGDAVQDAFASTPNVVTLSIHQFEPGFFPGTGSVKDVGFGMGMYHSLNVPLKEGIGDEKYFKIFEKVASKVIEVYRPEAIVCQCGCDCLTSDPLGGFNLTPVGIGRCVEKVLSWNIPTMFLGGGGYNSPNAARCWTYLTAMIVGKADVLESDIPEHPFFQRYGPGFELEIQEGLKRDKNNEKYVNEVLGEVLGCVEEIGRIQAEKASS